MMVSYLTDVSIIALNKRGIIGIIIDLDNTLTDWNCRYIGKDVYDWLKMLEKQGFRICVVSNSSAQRIESTLKNLELPYVSNALKPRKKAFLKAMQILNTLPQNTVVIGDQLFTDILGGKRLGLTTIFVTPRSKKEFPVTRLIRKLERQFLKKF